MNAGWGVYPDGDHNHVMPIKDERYHLVDDQCWCEPTMVDGVMVHHSLDRREDHEPGGGIPRKVS